jgi:hypothetical protein
VLTPRSAFLGNPLESCSSVSARVARAPVIFPELSPTTGLVDFHEAPPRNPNRNLLESSSLRSTAKRVDQLATSAQCSSDLHSLQLHPDTVPTNATTSLSVTSSLRDGTTISCRAVPLDQATLRSAASATCPWKPRPSLSEAASRDFINEQRFLSDLDQSLSRWEHVLPPSGVPYPDDASIQV